MKGELVLIEKVLSNWKELKNPYKCFNIYMRINKYKKAYKSSKIVIQNINSWSNTFFKCYLGLPNVEEIMDNFYNCNMEIKKEISINGSDLILICIIKNDKYKIEDFMLHYRSIGIKKFVFLDNNSDDGTYEYLLNQDDVFLFSVNDSYTSKRRDAWINRTIAYFGLNRWYLIVDSDELLTFYDCEKHNIIDFVRFLKVKRIKQCRALMVDMYGSKDFYKSNINNMKECCYFDCNSYREQIHSKLSLIVGGPRYRVFGNESWLTKYPLIYFQKGDLICNAHFSYPYNINITNECYIALRHYKFFPADMNKYHARIINKNFYNGSKEYEKYINIFNKKGDISFFDDSTCKYCSSKDLFVIQELNKVDWEV